MKSTWFWTSGQSSDNIDPYFTEFGTHTIEGDTYQDNLGMYWLGQGNSNTIVRKDRLCLYSGILFFDTNTWLDSLHIHDIDQLHQQLTNIDGQYSICIVTEQYVTIVKDFFSTRPLGYFIDNDTICVSNVPGLLNHLYNGHYVTPKNSIYTFDHAGNLLKRSKSNIWNYDDVSTTTQLVETIERAVERVNAKAPTALPRSSGFDSGMIDSISANCSHDLVSTMTVVGVEILETLNARYQYRKQHNKKILHKAISSVDSDDIDLACDLVGKYWGVNVVQFHTNTGAAYQMAKYFANTGAKQVINGNGKTYMWNSMQHYSRVQMLKGKIHWPQPSIPVDIKLHWEDTPLVGIDILAREFYGGDLIPYLLHDIEVYHLYYDWHIFQTWLQLSHSDKNTPNRVHMGDNLYEYDKTWFCTDIMTKYNYPYHTQISRGGPWPKGNPDLYDNRFLLKNEQ